MANENTVSEKRRFSIRCVDRLLHNLHMNKSWVSKLTIVIGSLFIYAVIVFLFGNSLEVSSNYFIIIPLIAVSFSFGLAGGIISGILALPLNLFMFFILGHPEYSPESKLIAELSGIVFGLSLGYLNDYYNEITVEVERRRVAEEKLQKSIKEKEILFHEIHHRVKNNLNIVKSLIQLQINRSDNPQFVEEAEKLIMRIHSIASVHERLYKGSNLAGPILNEYIPALVDDILAGIDEGDLAAEYSIDIPEIELDIERATSLGLIVNEVLTNAVKYSFSLIKSPRLEVVMRMDSDRVVLELVNNAPTFLPGKDEYNGLGLRLIQTLSKQLDAEYAYVPGSGTTFRLSLPREVEVEPLS